MNPVWVSIVLAVSSVVAQVMAWWLQRTRTKVEGQLENRRVSLEEVQVLHSIKDSTIQTLHTRLQAVEEDLDQCRNALYLGHRFRESSSERDDS